MASATEVSIRGTSSVHDAEDVVAAVGRRDQLRPAVGRVGHAHDVLVLLEVAHQLGHRLLGHLRATSEHADGGAAVIEVLEDGRLGGPHLLVPRGRRADPGPGR